ncbi:tyrosine-type recombinase/integrase [Tabrizicola sp.]|uniref:tyrosine-type recombinase/integrase n=1 Tax=Tabrizicola sp. TaxID=2005166 RepID=UPI0035B204C9
MRLLNLRGQVWWFMRDLPADCRAVYGKKTWLTNLCTSDVRAAMEQRDRLEVETTEAFKKMRAGTWNPKDALSAPERGQLYRDQIAALVGGSEGSDGTGERELVAFVEGDADEPDALELLVLAAEAERDSYRGAQRAAYEGAVKGAVTVDHHLDAYAAAISALAPATVAGRKGNIRQFARWAAEKKLRLDTITRKVAGAYVTATIDPMHPKTAETHLSSLRFYWSFLHARGHITGGDKKGGVWAGQQIKAVGKRAERGSKDEERPFTEAEVKTLLFSPFPPRMESGFETQIADALRISLLSGMRLEEIVTLWVEEVHDGVFDIQQGKTDAAARRVPIHPDLVELVARRKKDKGPKDWLFHELAEARDPGDIFGKRFRRYRLAVGVDDKKDGKRRSLVNFHSARHWFARTASFAGQSDKIIGSVIGHRPDKKDITFGVYIRETSEEQRKACVESVQLPACGSAAGEPASGDHQEE